jgi:hypothetical protein
MIQDHHLLRAKQLLSLYQQKGAFPADPEQYVTFVGKTKRNFATVQARFLKVPSTISFIRKGESKYLLEALKMFIQLFNARAPRGQKSKPHPFKYANSLVYYLNDSNAGPGLLLNKNDYLLTDSIKIINVAPHASTLEWRMVARSMYKIAGEIRARFGLKVSVRYDYISSDSVGFTYFGTEQGGPAGVAGIYALPVVWLGVAGAFTSTLRTPGANERQRRGRKARRRRRI